MATFGDVRAIAMALPEAEEIVTWETDITFRVRTKIFAIGGEGSDSVSIKATPAMQAELIDRDPSTFRPSAYVGRFGWVTVDLTRVDDEVLRSLVTEAWRRAAPKRLAATLG
ncbi:MAG TPA: MmcQ/YjbR family DNA-binding protein [Candidatus Limnocylindrales bacterium]|nr:MmcQ/YjbR family DNA-binding protein [Candidatus Limnocylindrales bacterium]